MSVDAVTSSISSLYTSSSKSSSSTQGGSSIDFVAILVAQLQNQNPLEPTDTNEFMNQLMSYSSIDQQQETNDKLGELVASFNSLMSANAVGYIGRTVEAYGDTTSLENGKASWGYSLDSAASEVTITVRDADGNVAWQGSGETGAGKHTFEWDGKDNDGAQLPEGEYSMEISATDKSGNSVLDFTTIIGQVDGIDGSSGTNFLDIGGVSVAFDDVIGIRA